ncbi:unnamed protein product [Paramecium primaurelia]|uniref:Uncharacterized protein n=1 Tax=Paramecium primaurelia TaxID=5886 RepID=A0A8S1LQI5_PARPR|nr:unnamed protein product [Paramecium primaurelia]
MRNSNPIINQNIIWISSTINYHKNQNLLRKNYQDLFRMSQKLTQMLVMAILNNFKIGYLKGEEILEQMANTLTFIILYLFKVQDVFDQRYILDDQLKLRRNKFELIQAYAECIGLMKILQQGKNQCMNQKLEKIMPTQLQTVQKDSIKLCYIYQQAIKYTLQERVTVEVKKKIILNIQELLMKFNPKTLMMISIFQKLIQIIVDKNL